MRSVNEVISRTRLGIAFRAIRESERAAAAIGIDLFRHKQIALVGTGIVWGPVAGVALMRVIDVALKNYLTLPVPALAVYGVILMAIGLFKPDGILAGVSRKRQTD